MTRMDRISLVLVGVFTLAAGIGLLTLQFSVQHNAYAGPKAQGEEERLLPLAEGASWTYRATDSANNLPIPFRYHTVSQQSVAEGQNCTKMTVQYGPSKYGQSAGREYWAVRADGIYQYHNTRVDERPGAPTPILPFPLRLGAHWDWSEAQRYTTFGAMGLPSGEVVHRRGMVEALDEVVTVPAGRYHAVRVLITGDCKTFGHSETRYWFAKDVGLVKRTEGDAKEPNQLVLALSAYTPADPKAATTEEALTLVERELQMPPQSLEPLIGNDFVECFRSRFVLVRYQNHQTLFRVADKQANSFDATDPDDWNRLLQEEGILKHPADPIFSAMKVGSACAFLIAAQQGYSITPDPSVSDYSVYKKPEGAGRQSGCHLSGTNPNGKRWSLSVRITVSDASITKIEIVK